MIGSWLGSLECSVADTLSLCLNPNAEDILRLANTEHAADHTVGFVELVTDQGEQQ